MEAENGGNERDVEFRVKTDILLCMQIPNMMQLNTKGQSDKTYI